jgi:benzodiazapine receptor
VVLPPSRRHYYPFMMSTPTLVAAGITIGVLAIGGAATNVGQWYQGLRKPSWNPPNWAFGPAWTVILGLAAWAGVLAWDHSTLPGERLRICLLFGANIVFHMAWSPLFFNLERPDWALKEVPFLWLSVLALMIGLAPLSATASLLLVPYLLWVAFAAYLNLVIVRLNRPFDR